MPSGMYHWQRAARFVAGFRLSHWQIPVLTPLAGLQRQPLGLFWIQAIAGLASLSHVFLDMAPLCLSLCDMYPLWNN